MSFLLVAAIFVLGLRVAALENGSTVAAEASASLLRIALCVAIVSAVLGAVYLIVG